MEAFIIPKWMLILSYILISQEKRKIITLTQIKDDLGISFSHALRMVQCFDDKEVLKKTKIGRRNSIALTAKGRKLAEKGLEITIYLEKNKYAVSDN